MNVASLFLLPLLLLTLCSLVCSQSAVSVTSTVIAGTTISVSSVQVTYFPSWCIRWRNPGTGTTGVMVNPVQVQNGQAILAAPTEPGTYVVDVLINGLESPQIYLTSNAFQVIVPPSPPPPQTSKTAKAPPTTINNQNPSSPPSQQSPTTTQSFPGGSGSPSGGVSVGASGETSSSSDFGSNIPTSDILDTSLLSTIATITTTQEYGSTADSRSTDTSQLSNNSAGSNIALKPIIGGAAGGVALVLVSFSLLLVCRRRRSRRRRRRRITESVSFYDGRNREMEGYERSNWRTTALTDPTPELPVSESEYSSSSRPFIVISGSYEPASSPSLAQGSDTTILHTSNAPPPRSLPSLVLDSVSSGSVPSPLTPQLAMPLSPLRCMSTPENEDFHTEDDESAPSYSSRNTVIRHSYLREGSSPRQYPPEKSGFREADLAESHLSPASLLGESPASSPTAFAPRRFSLDRVHRLYNSQLGHDLSFVMAPVGNSTSSHPESEREGAQSRDRKRAIDAGALDFPEQPPGYDEVLRSRNHHS